MEVLSDLKGSGGMSEDGIFSWCLANRANVTDYPEMTWKSDNQSVVMHGVWLWLITNSLDISKYVSH